MARSKKKTKASPTRRGTARTAKKKTAKKAPKKAAKKTSTKASGRGRTGKDETDVERRWREYWECRQALESAVEAVREAEARLAEARETERERRTVFDRTKDDLRGLLEVEPASSAGPPPPPPPSFEQTRLGVVEDETDEDEDAEDTEHDEADEA